MGIKYIAPSVETSFSCPHCGALAKQTWFELGIEYKDKDFIPTPFREDLEEWLLGPDAPESFSDEIKAKLIEQAKRQRAGEVYYEKTEAYYGSRSVLRNLHVSQCYNCDALSVWIARELAYPVYAFDFVPADNMPDNVKRDFVEASKLFRLSPRASAALLRVAIEELCNEINGEELSIFKGIGKLVEDGLDPKIQQALDFVRVTGNDAVHPGQITPNDTPEVAQKLFMLVNLIVEKLITLPMEIDQLYKTIPPGKREAIEKRDGSTT
jgi:diadenosine tetraphosphatase ApaH/serine/threonine PP2A family protein phosphatase